MQNVPTRAANRAISRAAASTAPQPLPQRYVQVQKCTNLAGVPALHTEQQICETNAFLCQRCMATCGFCAGTLPSGRPCRDVPNSMCSSYVTTSFNETTLGGSFKALTPHRFCEAALPQGEALISDRGIWSETASDGMRYTLTDGLDNPAAVAGPARRKRGPAAQSASAALRRCLQLRRSSCHTEIRQCLAGRPLVLVGDSNMRYQYLALARFLHSGHWDTWPRQPNGRSTMTRFSVCNENSGAKRGGAKATDPVKWQRYFNRSVAELGGKDLCECHRELVATPWENRWFVDGDVRLGFSWFTSLTSHVSLMRRWASWETMRDRCGRTGCDQTQIASPSALVSLSAPAFVRERLGPLRPSAVLFGPGAWVQPDAADAQLTRNLRGVMTHIKELVGPRGHALFRTCLRGAWNHRRGSLGCGATSGCDEPFRLLINQTGWKLLDAYRVTDELHRFRNLVRATCDESKGRCERNMRETGDYVDPMHMNCDVLRELNLLLVAKVCGEDTDL